MSSPKAYPTVLLTGAGSGIGLNVLGQLLEKHSGTRVQVLTLFPTPELTALEQKYGPSCLNTVYGDACDTEIVAKAVKATISNYGTMTHLISSVGTMLPVQSIREVPLGEMRKIFDINFFSVFDLVQRSLPHLSAWGEGARKPTVIIVTSGVDYDVLYRGWTGYCTSKAALTRFIHLLAHEEPGLEVYGVLPLVTKSPMVDKIFNGEYDHVMRPEERERFNTWAREGKIEPPEYIAESIVKAATGQITPASKEVERNDCGALFIGSLYQKQ
ncbi:hypothetical protein A1O1_01511 [Capronia coronata CBS 617.96]|uniref:Ketoreductase (KR) domain-containing protein n=1 Tax=Capronia coronata CBS 617.96 TaxID=1182541 RepID=W9Z368_9EURO|nr:uncharacterized protein A1O1_01511 [Capronia coronata CBS 617.96]EXJ96385.1 hypothetical protein A1O1_01511 [Capronia coronata CBS 617.96]